VPRRGASVIGDFEQGASGAGRCAWLGESLFLGRGRLTGPKASRTRCTGSR